MGQSMLDCPITNKGVRMTKQHWWNYSIEELEQMADENGKISKEAMDKYNEDMTKDNEQEHQY
jgi:hypothetical protein